MNDPSTPEHREKREKLIRVSKYKKRRKRSSSKQPLTKNKVVKKSVSYLLMFLFAVICIAVIVYGLYVWLVVDRP